MGTRNKFARVSPISKPVLPEGAASIIAAYNISASSPLVNLGSGLECRLPLNAAIPAAKMNLKLIWLVHTPFLNLL